MSTQPHPTLTADFINAFPDGTRDKSTYSDIEDALDRAGARARGLNNSWLTLPQRIAELTEDRDRLRSYLQKINDDTKQMLEAAEALSRD